MTESTATLEMLAQGFQPVGSNTDRLTHSSGYTVLI